MTGLGTAVEFIFALSLMLGVVITVHEFGHFIVAKLCGVRILKFSVGFGSAVGFGRFRLRGVRNGTEYALSWLPLGGYVRMQGEYGEETDGIPPGPGEPFSEKALWQKLLILVAGPGMNLLLPVLLFAAALWVGVERPEAVVGSVERGSPAAEAGLLPGDRIAAIDGEPVRWWSEVEEAVRGNPGDRVALEVARGDERIPIPLEIGSRRGVDTFRTPAEVGWLGLRHHRQMPVIGVPSSDSAAAAAGFHSGDRIVSVDGHIVEDWGSFAQRVLAGTGSVDIVLERGGEGEAERVELAMPPAEHLEAFGLIPAVVLVAQVAPDSAASEAGVEAGDLIVAVDGEPVGSFFTFQETVLGSEGRTLDVSIARDGESLTVPIAPRLMETEVAGTRQDAYRIGIHGENAVLAGTLALDQTRNPIVAVARGAQQTAEITVLFLRGLKKLVAGDISRKNIGGPIEIARQSHNALRDGWDRFMNVLILISINIGILNLLPIPMLDGGQAIVYSVESLKRGPLSQRTRLLVQQVGVVFLLSIMGFAFWNDISRNWSSFFEWFKNLVA